MLITGESGHGQGSNGNFYSPVGPRQSKPFIAINCAAIANTLLESELLDTKPTLLPAPPTKRKNGLMEVADGGILFWMRFFRCLDMQAKLLRAIEEHPSQGRRHYADLVDVQIIAASNQDLKK